MEGRYDHLFSEDSVTPDLGVPPDTSQGNRYDHFFDGLDSPEEEIITPEVASELPVTSPLFSKPEVPETPSFQEQMPDTIASGSDLGEQYPIVPDQPVQPDQRIFQAGDLIDSLKSGSYDMAGRMLNLWADKERAYRENPELYMQKIAGLSPYAGLGAMFGGEPGYTEAQAQVSKEQEIALLEEASKWFEKSSALGRPLSWKETEFGTNFLD